MVDAAVAATASVLGVSESGADNFSGALRVGRDMRRRSSMQHSKGGGEACGRWASEEGHRVDSPAGFVHVGPADSPLAPETGFSRTFLYEGLQEISSGWGDVSRQIIAAAALYHFAS